MKNIMLKYLCQIFVLVIICDSCLNQQYVDGRADFIGISDTSINDSSIFEGHVYRIDYVGNYSNEAMPFAIWIENSDNKTQTDSMGYYLIKTLPGTYTIKCQDGSESWSKLIEGVSDISIGKNEKAKIDFYIGYAFE